MYQLFQTDIGSRGSLAEVWIDREKKLVKKYYRPNNTTITGKIYHSDIEEITKLFNNEIYWSTKLKSKLVLETYEYGELNDEQGYYLLQEWIGPDLLHHERGHTVKDEFPNLKIQFPKIIDQLEEMFVLFQEHNVHKINNAMCNLVGANGNIKAFDFKYATERTEESKIWELHSIDTWLSKIDPKLKTILRKYV